MPSTLISLLIVLALARSASFISLQQLEPTISPFFFDQNVQENQRLSVLCSISSGDVNNLTISWLKDGQYLNSQLAQAKKIIIKPDSDQSTLKFTSVRLDHAGNYTCVAKNRAGIHAYSAQLIVHGAPRWFKEPPNEPIVSTKGQTIVIDCVTTGWPKPQQTWQVKTHLQNEFESLNPSATAGRISLASNGSLIIRNVDKYDEANYLCSSYNGIGSGISWSTSLKVVVPAHFSVVKHQPSVIRKQNQVQLRCDAFGDEPITIEWFKNKQKLANELDPRFSVQNKPLQNGLISILVIKSAQRQDNSVYECITRNSAGKDRMPIELVVQEEPDSIQEMKVTQTNSRSIQLEWLEPYDGKSSITNYVFQYKKQQAYHHQQHQQHQQQVELIHTTDSNINNQQLVMYSNQHQHATSEINLSANANNKLIGGQDEEWQHASRIMLPVQANSSSGSGEIRSITIEKLEPSSRYVVRALAMNAIGQGRFGPAIEFRTEDEAPEASPSNIKAQAINSTSILVSWDDLGSTTRQASRIHGYYVGYRLASLSASSAQRNASTSGSNNFVYKPYLLTSELNQPQELTRYPARLEFTLNDLRSDTVYEITVVAFNARGSGPSSDFVLCKTIEMEPPKPVRIQIRRESNDSIHIEWSRDPTDQNPVDDYVLYQEKNSNSQEWVQINLPGNQTHYKATGLKCGTRYQFYMVAHNKVGKSLHSEVVGASTSGALPGIPSKRSLLKAVNSTCLLVNLNAFQDNGCSIRAFTARYKVEKGQPAQHSLISAANGLAVQHQALTALNKVPSSNSASASGSVVGSVQSTSSALAATQTDWVTIIPKINPKHPRALEDDRMEYICDLSPVGEYTLHVAAQNDVGRSEIEYTVLMSSDELRYSALREFGELLSGLPNVFAYIPSLIVFLLAGLFVSLASLILYTTIIKYYQKFVIIHNQIRASRRAKQDERRRRKLMNASASSRQSQKLDLWADEFDDDDEDDDENAVDADGDDEANDEDENSSSSGSSGSGLNRQLHRRQMSHQQQLVHLDYVKQRQQQQQQQRRHRHSGHYTSNIANSAFDTSSIESRCNNSLGKQCFNTNSTCLSTASTDSIHGQFQCLNSKQYVKMNEYTMLPSISASLSPPRAADIYGTATGARPSPQHQLPAVVQPDRQTSASGPNNDASIYYSAMRRSNMQTYRPPQRNATSSTLNRQTANIADIYGYYMAPTQPQQQNQQQPPPQQLIAGNLNRNLPQATEEVANSIFVPPQQIIYSAPNIRHQRAMFL